MSAEYHRASLGAPDAGLPGRGARPGTPLPEGGVRADEDHLPNDLAAVRRATSLPDRELGLVTSEHLRGGKRS